MRVESDGPFTIVTINRPEIRNAVDEPARIALASAFRAFDGDGRRGPPRGSRVTTGHPAKGMS